MSNLEGTLELMANPLIEASELGNLQGLVLKKVVPDRKFNCPYLRHREAE